MEEKNSAMELIQNPTAAQKRRFLIPSLIGVFVFLFPVWVEGDMTIPLGVISDGIASFIEPGAAHITLVVVTISAIMSMIASFLKPKSITSSRFLTKLFMCSPTYAVIRVLGAVISYMVFFSAGPEWIWSPDTGWMMMGLISTLLAWFFAASFLIPLLMDYGIMDYTGTMLRNFLGPLFHLPGRAAIDLCASWIGNCNVGVVLTSTQYEQGYYTARESALIATCFSAVSLPFCLVTAAMLEVDKFFIPFYLILTITGIVSAFVMCRIWPLGTKFPNEYYAPVGKQVFESEPAGMKKSEWAFKLAVTRAQSGPNVKTLFRQGVEMFLEIIFSLLPISMFIGTIALVLTTYTPVFDWISMPFGYYLQLLGVEDAFRAAPGTLVGFADMFIPAIICAGLESFRTRFIIGVLCLVQIIYITGPGILMITSKMPIKLMDLIIIFIEKTVISIPIIVVLTNVAGMIFGF